MQTDKEIKKETEFLELKKSTSELKEAIISIVSILNKHQKGDLYFGIKNNSDVVGQTVTENTIREISQALSDNVEPKIFPKINDVLINGKTCVHVAFTGENIPYYAFGRAYIRIGDEDKKISPQELERFILKKNKVLWEEGISEKTLRDINEESVRTFVEKANAAQRINFKFTNLKAVLNKLGLMKNGKLLKAAEVLFCEDNPFEVQAAVFAGTDKVTFLDIRQFKGNIFQLFQLSESYIKEHINWRAELQQRERKEIPEIPLRAITEALVNALCHRDYTNRKGNEIAIFKDRVEIYNPGQFPEGYTPKDFIKGSERSILRNPLIAHTLYLSKDIERWGSGLKRIYDTCKENDTVVDFLNMKNGFLVSFKRKSTIAIEKKEDLGSEKSSEKSSEKIISLIRKNKSISAREIAKFIGISQRAVEKHLAILKKKSIIKRIGGTKGGYWEPCQQTKK